MAADWTLRAVQKLQARLALSTDPEKLQKYLQKLSTLPITADILAETGVRRTVKSLRKHELLGSFAKDLAAQWKKIALVERMPGPYQQAFEDSLSRKRHRDALQEDGEIPGGHQGNWRSPLEGLQGTGPVRQSKAHESPSRENGPVDAMGDEKAPDLIPETSPKAFSKGNSGKFLLALETALDSHPEKPESKGSKDTQWDENEPSPDSLGTGARAADQLPKVKEISINPQTLKVKLKISNWYRKPADDEFEAPIMSFEEYLNYDQPQKKKKRTGELKKLPAEAAVLPDLPSPRLQADWSPPPPLERMASFQPDGKAPSAPQKDEEAGFTGHRVNSKMPVYSGSKCEDPSTRMTLQPQSTQVLTKDTDSVLEVKIPYSVFEPILEKCTPAQLHLIEKYNQGLLEETDRFWKMHCHKDFKLEKPREHESWREMYLRLQDAQEQRLQALTLSIQSAHAQKPQGRQTKMIFFNPGTNACPSTSKAPLMAGVNTRVRTAKKIAPLMAKTLRDYKNRYTRR